MYRSSALSLFGDCPVLCSTTKHRGTGQRTADQRASGLAFCAGHARLYRSSGSVKQTDIVKELARFLSVFPENRSGFTNSLECGFVVACCHGYLLQNLELLTKDL